MNETVPGHTNALAFLARSPCFAQLQTPISEVEPFAICYQRSSSYRVVSVVAWLANPQRLLWDRRARHVELYRVCSRGCCTAEPFCLVRGSDRSMRSNV